MLTCTQCKVLPRLCPPMFSIFLLYFRLYEVVSLHMCVLPSTYRKTLGMLLTLTKLCEIICSQDLQLQRTKTSIILTLTQCPI